MILAGVFTVTKSVCPAIAENALTRLSFVILSREVLLVCSILSLNDNPQMYNSFFNNLLFSVSGCAFRIVLKISSVNEPHLAFFLLLSAFLKL